MHFPSTGLQGNVLKPHITQPIQRFRYLSLCWGAVEVGTGLDLSLDIIPYNLEPYDNNHDEKCGGKIINTLSDISSDNYFLELQTKFMNLLLLKVLITFGQKPNKFMLINENLKHSEYIDGPNCHPSCLIKRNLSNGASESNKRGWIKCANIYGGDLELINSFSPTNEEKDRFEATRYGGALESQAQRDQRVLHQFDGALESQHQRDQRVLHQFGGALESQHQRDQRVLHQFGGALESQAQRDHSFGGALESQAQRDGYIYGGASKEGTGIFYKSNVSKECTKCGRIREIGAAVHKLKKIYGGVCKCTKTLRYKLIEVQVDNERVQNFKSRK